MERTLKRNGTETSPFFSLLLYLPKTYWLAAHTLYRWFFSTYTKLRIVHYQSKGYKPYTIANLMKENDRIVISRYGVAKFLKVY